MFMGVCRLPGKKYRRIDIKVYPASQYGFATLYFTGSAQLNKNMRVLALKHGFSISDKAITKLDNYKKDAGADPKVAKALANLYKLSQTKPVTEAEIFAGCGMAYLEPSKREI